MHLFKALTRQDHKALAPVIAAHASSDGVIIDIGGHAGQFTKLFSKIVCEGDVHAFEPGSYALSILRPMIRVKGLRNVSVHPFALGDRIEDLTFNVPLKRSGSVGFGLSHLGAGDDQRTYVHEVVHQTTLDKFVEDEGVPRVDLIKADIEGWEGRMLAGAVETLKRFKPVLYLELAASRLARAGDSVEGIWSLLTGMSYEGWVFDEAAHALRPAASGSSGDVWFIVPGQAQ